MLRRKFNRKFSGQQGPVITEYEHVHLLRVDWTKGLGVEGVCELLDVHKKTIASFAVNYVKIYDPNVSWIYADTLRIGVEFFMLKKLFRFDRFGDGDAVVITDNVQKWEKED